MGRVRANIQVNGHKLWTLFDTGAINTYVLGEVAQSLVRVTLTTPRHVPLGGKVHQINELAVLSATVEGHAVELDSYVIDDIGLDEDGKRIEILFGALGMEKWRIKIDPYNRALDMSNYPKEFVEF